MNIESSHITKQNLIDKNRWAEILKRFIDVLRINLFIVDDHGKVILPPLKERYGWELLAASPIGFDLLNEHSRFLDKFKRHGFYLEYNYRFDLHSFAIPIAINKGRPIAYIIVGPVILNKRLDKSEYRKIAQKFSAESKNLLDAINEIRVLSYVGIKSILDLVDEVAKYIIQLKAQQKALHKTRFKKEVLPEKFRHTAEHIYSSICLDELLITFLDAALKLSRVECGSVMVVDEENGDLTIRVSRGIDDKIAQKTRVKIGEGVAGLAARDNTSFVLHGTTHEDNRITKYLKRPEIKHAFVTPMVAQNKILGVLNLHTKNEGEYLNKESLDTVQTLSNLASVAIKSIQQKI